MTNSALEESYKHIEKVQLTTTRTGYNLSGSTVTQHANNAAYANSDNNDGPKYPNVIIGTKTFRCI